MSLENIRSVSQNIDINDPLTRSMLEMMVQVGKDAKSGSKIGDKYATKINQNSKEKA